MDLIMSKNTKLPNTVESRKLVSRLRIQHDLAYTKFAPKEIEALKNHRNWLKKPEQEILRAIKSLEKKLVHIKTPLNKGVIQKTIFDLREANLVMSQISKSFCNNLDLNKKYLQKLITEKSPQDEALPLPTNHTLALLSKEYGGPKLLKKAFEKTPTLVPIGIKLDITADAIRRRIKKYNIK